MEHLTLTEDHALQAYQYTLDGTCEEVGTVDSPVGWSALVPPEALPGIAEGWIVVERDPAGRVYGTEFMQEKDARDEFARRERLYAESEREAW